MPLMSVYLLAFVHKELCLGRLGSVYFSLLRLPVLRKSQIKATVYVTRLSVGITSS